MPDPYLRPSEWLRVFVAATVDVFGRPSPDGLAVTYDGSGHRDAPRWECAPGWFASIRQTGNVFPDYVGIASYLTETSTGRSWYIELRLAPDGWATSSPVAWEEVDHPAEARRFVAALETRLAAEHALRHGKATSDEISSSPHQP